MGNNENIVFIGKKPTMAYVLAVVTQVNGGADTVMLKARGRAISRAVDVAEIVQHKFINDISVNDIKISTEDAVSKEGAQVKVSAIEISLKK